MLFYKNHNECTRILEYLRCLCAVVLHLEIFLLILIKEKLFSAFAKWKHYYLFPFNLTHYYPYNYDILSEFSFRSISIYYGKNRLILEITVVSVYEIYSMD